MALSYMMSWRIRLQNKKAAIRPLSVGHMQYTENDLYLYRELLKASKDQLCKNLPKTVTQRDVQRLCELGLCSCEVPNELFLLYNKYELSDLEKQLQRNQEEHAKHKAAEDAQRANLDEQTQKQFRHDWRITIVGGLINFALGAIFDHFFDIVGYAANFFRSLFP